MTSCCADELLSQICVQGSATTAGLLCMLGAVTIFTARCWKMACKLCMLRTENSNNLHTVCATPIAHQATDSLREHHVTIHAGQHFTSGSPAKTPSATAWMTWRQQSALPAGCPIIAAGGQAPAAPLLLLLPPTKTQLLQSNAQQCTDCRGRRRYCTTALPLQLLPTLKQQLLPPDPCQQRLHIVRSTYVHR
jgi:hypothetical protein